MTITTERLALRPWRDGDKPGFAALVNTPGMMAHMGGVKPRAEIDAILDAQMAMQRAQGLSMWAVERREDGALIGICGLRYSSHPGTPIADMLEIGWRVGEAHWRRGYAREAAEASLAWGFAHTTRDRILAWTVPANRPSRGLMARLGMTRRPELDFDHPRFPAGHPVRAHVVYGIERPAALT